MRAPELAYGMLSTATADPRARALLRGRPSLASVEASPRVQEALRNPRIDRSMDVREGAGAEMGAPVTLVDKDVPRVAEAGGKAYDPAQFVNVHEQVEEEALRRLRGQGVPVKQAYDVAHTQYADKAERQAVEASGIPWRGYQNDWRDYLRSSQHERGAVQNPRVDPDQTVTGGKGPAPEWAYGMLASAADNPADRETLWPSAVEGMSPAERAALRLREAQRPSRGRAYSPGQEALLNTLMPQTPLDYGLLAMGPAGRALGVAGRVGALGIGAALQPSEAEAGPLAAVRRFIRAYHGSPYSFDKFDVSKIGTGEGNQAFGHGLYFAENPSVAETYKNSPRVTDMDWRVLGGPEGLTVPAWVARGAQSSRTRASEILADFEQRVAEAEATQHWNLEGIKRTRDAVKGHLSGEMQFQKPGHMYEVNINAEPEDFLHLDRPLSEQSYLGKDVAGWAKQYLYGDVPSMTGQDVYRGVAAVDAPWTASKELAGRGIPGLRYLDEGSRGLISPGSATHNMVVFDPGIVDILRKYGIAGGIAGAGAMQPGEAEAGPADVARKAASGLWHEISKVKLPRPVSEMEARHVGKPIAERTITPEALEGGLLLPAWGDRAIAGTRLTHIGGEKLPDWVRTQGGFQFMPMNEPYGTAWASGQSVISDLANEARRLAESGKPVYFPYTAMAPRSVDFSHHMSDALVNMMRAQGVPRGGAAELDAIMRAHAPSWPGSYSPNLAQYLVEGPGDIRTKFAQAIDTRELQNLGLPSAAEARHAVIHPELLDVPTGSSGRAIARLDPEGRVISEPEKPHRSYSHQLGGQYIGGFEHPVPLEMMYPDVMTWLKAEGKRRGLPYLEPGGQRPDYLMQRGVTGMPAQEATPQWVDTLSQYMEQANRRQ